MVRSHPQMGAGLAALFLGLAGVPTVSAQMFGTGYSGTAGPSTFYTIDIATGTATVVGPVGFNRCGGMDVGPGDVVYATCETAAALPVLITINPMTGAGTQIGPTGMNGAVGDISFRGADGVLFAYDAANDPIHSLFTVNTATGAATLVGDTGITVAPGNGIGHDPGGTLFLLSTDTNPMPELYTLNQTTGQAVFVMDINIPGGCSSFACRFNGMDLDPISGVMYGLMNDSAGGPGNRFLTTVDVGTGAVTIIGPTAPDLDAIAFPVFVPVELQSFSVE